MKGPHLGSVQTFLADPANAGYPLHDRIQRSIRQLILEGALPGGRALPPTRDFARSLSVSRDTVESAYAQLHAEGFITRRVGSGSFVSEIPDFTPMRRVGRRLAPPLHIAERGRAMAEGGGVTTAPARAFTPGIPETRSFPIEKWDRLQRQVLEDHGSEALRHGDPQGEEPLRRAIAEHVNLERGGRAGADRILVVTSSQQALWLCATVLFDQGDRIVVEDPVYPGARRAFDAAGLEAVPIGVDGHGMDADALRRVKTVARGAYLVPSHQYPTGTTLSLERRLALLEWAASQRAWIIEDDYDGEFHYVGRPTACIQGLDPHDRTLYIGTFTKTMFPGLRLAYIVLPPNLVAPMVAARTLLDGFTATVPQLTLTRFMEAGHFRAHVRKMSAIYAERLDALLTMVATRFPGLVEARPPPGGLQMPCWLPDCASDRGRTEADTIAAARQAGVELAGLSPFYAKPGGGAGWLMGFAAYSPTEMASAGATLASALKRARVMR